MAGRPGFNQEERKTNIKMLKNPYLGKFIVFEGLDGEQSIEKIAKEAAEIVTAKLG